jgi:dipeptidase E
VTGQIVAMGGGTFLVEDHDPRIDAFILSLTGRPRPRVCYLGTAGGDHERGMHAFYRAMSRHDCRPTELTFFERVIEDLEAFVNDQDVFCRRSSAAAINSSCSGPHFSIPAGIGPVKVAGGSTANLLAVWRLHGLDSLLRTAYERGAVLCGVSAGMNCWFAGSTTDSFGPTLRSLPDGLGFLAGSACPHYDTHPERRPLFRRLVDSGALPAGWGADDFAALHFRDGELVEAVAWRDEARGYRVEPGTEIPLPTRIL